MSLLQDLIQGRERIARGWCRGADARDADGISVSRSDEKAVEWDARGALLDCEPGCLVLLRDFLEPKWDRNILAWNDAPERSKAEVLETYDRAIAKARALEADELHIDAGPIHYHCRFCRAPVRREQSAFVRQAIIRRACGTVPGEELYECLKCVEESFPKGASNVVVSVSVGAMGLCTAD